MSFNELKMALAVPVRENRGVSPTLVVLTFGEFNNHESLVKENGIPPYPGDIVEPKEASK